MGEYWEESIGFYKDAYESHGRKKIPCSAWPQRILLNKAFQLNMFG